LKNLISFDHFDIDIHSQAESVGINLHHIQQVIDIGINASNNQEEFKFDEPTNESVYMFCYTSGTTGDPKAVKISHRNILSVATSANYAGVEIFPWDTMISYLPLAHSFEKVLFTLCLVKGVRIGYYCGDVLKLTDDC
jgi:long-chain acyl-CoA synthetase